MIFADMSWDDFYKAIQEDYHIEDEATVIKIPFDNIIEMTSEELVYKNEDGEIFGYYLNTEVIEKYGEKQEKKYKILWFCR